MDPQVRGALIAAVVGILTSLLASYLTWKVERRKWLIGLKANLQIELQKTRLQSYSSVFETLEKVSSLERPGLTAEVAVQVRKEFNHWLYSSGGMVAEASTRAAILVMREAMGTWATTERVPDEFVLWRNRALVLLRRDIDLGSPEVFDASDEDLLRQVKRDAERVLRGKRLRRKGSKLVR